MIRYNTDNKEYEAYHESAFAALRRNYADGDYISNLSLAASVAANALTISLKDSTGVNPSLGSPAIVAFRNSTLTSGDITLLKITSSLSTVISSGSTAGSSSGIQFPLWVGVMNVSGTAELCWSGTPWNESELVTTTAEGGAGAAGSKTTIYSTTARTNVAARIVGKMLFTEATAGTWASVPSNISSGSGPMVGSYIPMTVQRFLIGTSQTYTLPTAPRKPLYIKVKMVGGGGGGSGGGTTSIGTGGNGGNTTFGSNTASGGVGGIGGSGGSGGTGGGTSVGTGTTIVAVTGGVGGAPAQNVTLNSAVLMGAYGGSSYFGGNGGGGTYAAVAVGAAANSGSGGGGANMLSAAAGQFSGSGGGAGGYIEVIIPNPAATYTYTVGAAGTAGTAGTNGVAGGAGGAGIIIVEEYYQ
jgi:hypothetical protein